MRLNIFFKFLVCIVLTERSEQSEDAYLSFPEGFTLGAGGAAYQIEGGWNASDKSESIWDRCLHTQPWIVEDGTNGDIACDSYHKYKEDVKWLKNMELDHYRMSISWARLLPNGFANSISRDGLRYYHNVIDELIDNGIEPIVTIYHWDHPQVIEENGGWLNQSMVEWFTDYADVIFMEFGPKVKVFITLNEPEVLCPMIYSDPVVSDRNQRIRATYMCGLNALKAHARVYHLYDQKYRPTQHGKISLVTFSYYYFSNNSKDAVAAETMFQYMTGWLTHPIFIGGYHDIIKNRIATLNREAPTTESRIPELSPEWINYINGTFDYFGLSHYTSWFARFGAVSRTDPSFYDFMGIVLSMDPRWKSDASGKWAFVPKGFGHILRKIKSDYNNPLVYIMENGVEDIEPINDNVRMRFLHSYLKELLLAVNRDGCNVQKYTVWSLMDTFQWSSGYKFPMGLIHVDFSSPNRDRSPKLSASWIRKVARTRRLLPPIYSAS